MNLPWTLHRYLAYQFLAGVGIVFAGFVFLSFSIDVVDIFDHTAGKDVPTSAVIGMGLLQMPSLALKLLPFAILLGGVFAFVRLSRSHELLAIRAAGVSAWNLLAPSLVVAVALGIFAVMVFTPFSSRMLVEFTALEAKYIRGQASQLDISRNGMWLRQGDAHAQSVVHALRVANQGVQLEDVMIFRYGAGDRFTGRIEARSAQLVQGAWMLHDAWVSDSEGNPKYYGSYSVPTTLTPVAHSGKLRTAGHAVVLGVARLYSYGGAGRVSVLRAICSISTHCSHCRRCLRRWCSWRRAFPCVWRGWAAWAASSYKALSQVSVSISSAWSRRRSGNRQSCRSRWPPPRPPQRQFSSA